MRRIEVINYLITFAVMLAALFMAAPAMAGTQSLGTPVDSSSDVSVPVTDHLMVTIPSSASQGGNDATSATVSITGTVALADVAEVAAFYGGVEAGRLAITGLSNQVIDLPGNTKGNQDWTFFISLNASAGGKTFGLTVESIAGTNNNGLPFGTVDRNATGSGAPEITVLGNATEIVDGDTTPSLTDDTDFDSAVVATTVDHTFTVQNDGTADLTVGSVTVSDTTNFSVTVQPAATVAASNSTTFTVRFQPQSAATFPATVTIPNNDSGENPYTFDITGTGIVSPPTVASPDATSIGDTTATLGGTVTAINDTSITERGIYWSTTPGFTPPGQGTKASTTGTWSGTPQTFTEDVIGLPSGQIVYFQAFAINNPGGTGYTGEAAFRTEPTQVPPLSVGFESVGPTSMIITWTAGGGDGAIVVVKEGSAVEVGVYDPVDGTEHPFNSSFGDLATDLGNNNYVVYRGPANSAPVSGLTPDTTYYVAVYEYAGTGSGQSGINYQQDSPATGSQLTTIGGTGHNADHNITNCDQCHAMHGGYGSVPYGSDQETVCKACHKETQMGAENPQLWDVGMHEVTKGGPQTVDCGSCHDVHNGSGVAVVGANLKRIRRNTTKYITGALEPALYEVQDVDFAFDENTSPWNGICQSCHTNSSMKWHTNAGQASEADPHNHNMSGGVPNPVCTVCHTHSGGFSASGGSCNSCHDNIKNAGGTPVTGKPERRIIWNAAGDAGDFIKTSHHATDGTTTTPPTENDCAVCHEEPSTNHMDGVVNLKNPDTGISFTITDLQENPGEAVTIQNNICLPCHDLDGASVTWNSTEGTSAVRPFSSNTKDVPDVFDQFDTANNTYHPVRGATGTPSLGITVNTMVSPWDTNIGTQTMTCFDCHYSNAHGSDYQKMIPVEDPASPGTYYGMDFNYYETFSGDMSKATLPTPGDGAPASMDSYNERIEVFCTKCHDPSVYVTGADGFSVFEKHGANQGQHSAAGGNQLACLGCHGGFIQQNDPGNPYNGAANGNIHGVQWDWSADGGNVFGSKSWPGVAPNDSVANNFMVGGWLDGWSAQGECAGGNCNHTGDSGGGKQSFSPAID